MPTNLIAGDFVQIRSVYKGPTGQEAYNIMTYVVGVVTGVVTDLDFAHTWGALNYVAILNALPTNCRWDGCEASIINRTPVPLTQVSTLHAGVGIYPIGYPLAPQVTGLISWGTLFGGPGYRGRIYFPWVPADQLGTNGYPIAGYLSLLSSVATAITGMVSVTGSGGSAACYIGLYHRLSQLVDTVTNWYVHGKFGTQRRRGNYGKNRIPPI